MEGGVRRPRSLGDVCDGVLESWGKFFRLIFLCLLLGALTVGSVWLLLWGTRTAGLKASMVELSASPRIVLQQETEDTHEFLVVVQPQGWQNSGIVVHSGERFEIQAEGLVNISLNSLVENVEARHRIERRLTAERAARAAPPDSNWLPEREYTPADRDSLRLLRPWIGPDGYPGPEGLRDSRYPARTKNKLVPGAPYGALVAAVHRGATPPQRQTAFSNAFAAGASFARKWDGPEGTLWFAVNDVWDDADPAFPEKFFIDNVGFFVVRISVNKSS
jgi:hypothetical protein